MPRACQCMLMSATTNADVERLQQLILHNPVQLDLLAAVPGSADGLANGAGPGPGSAAEIASLKAQNYDLLMSIPSDSAEDDVEQETNVVEADIMPDDLFESKD